MQGTDSNSGPLRILFAWGVHLLTASGAVIGMLAILAIGAGDFERAGVLMLLALAIDSVDGTLARAAAVAEVVPGIDGGRLDDIVDYFNYVVVPALFLLALGALPHWLFSVPLLLSSAYGFSQRDAKTEDAFFLGWPSYWNVVALQAWLLETSPSVTVGFVLLFSVLVFVPLRYVYPSRTPVLRATTNAGAVLWVLVTTWAVLSPDRARELRVVEISLLYPAYYLGLSMWLGDWFGLRKAR